MPLIGEGNYGCVFRPYVKCGKEKFPKAVGKVFVDATENNYEHEIYDKVVKEIDPNFTFTLPLYKACDVITFRKSNAADACSLIDKSKLQRYPQLIYKDGGHSLKDVMKQKGTITKFKRIMTKLRPILVGIDAIIQHGYVHQDIKPHNIMFDGDRLYLIDFGITKPKEQVFRMDNMHVLKYDYPYYPPEYKVYALRNMSINHFVSKVYANFDFTFNIGGEHVSNVLEIIKSVIGIETRNELQKSFSKIRRGPKAVFRTDKIDLYSLGIVILELFIWSGLHTRQYKRKNKNTTFKDQTIELIRGLTHFDVEARFTCQQAIESYDKIMF